MALQRYSSFSNVSYQAQQIWLVLISKAYNWETTTYGEIAEILGFNGAGVLDRQLGHIMHFCEQNKLPPLTILVVNQDTGSPGDGFNTVVDFNAARARVFNFHWYKLIPPTPDDFAYAWEQA